MSYTLDYFAQNAINRRPTLHDIIHYVAWMGYIEETKYYPMTCKEAAEHAEFAYANSRATYGKHKSTRLQILCGRAWNSQHIREQQGWVNTIKDHERWHYTTAKGTIPINIRKEKLHIQWRIQRLYQLLALAGVYCKKNMARVINQKNEMGQSAMHAAVRSGNVELVRLFIETGGYPEGDLPVLYDAPLPLVEGEDEDCAKPPPPRHASNPAHRSANILQPFLSGKSTLTVALELDDSAMVAELLRLGHRIDVSDFRPRGRGATPIQKAIQCNAVKSVCVLIHAGVPLKGLLTDAILSLYGRCKEMIRTLVQHGADVNETNEYDKTPLMTATMTRNWDQYEQHVEHSMRPLLELGALVDMRDDLGQTALFLAAVRENVPAVKLLLEYGANTQLRDNRGILPSEMTETEEIKILIARADMKRKYTKRKR